MFQGEPFLTELTNLEPKQQATGELSKTTSL